MDHLAQGSPLCVAILVVRVSPTPHRSTWHWTEVYAHSEPSVCSLHAGQYSLVKRSPCEVTTFLQGANQLFGSLQFEFLSFVVFVWNRFMYQISPESSVIPSSRAKGISNKQILCLVSGVNKYPTVPKRSQKECPPMRCDKKQLSKMLSKCFKCSQVP